MFLIDMEEGRIVNDSELKEAIAKEAPYGEWLQEKRLSLEDLPEVASKHEDNYASIEDRQKAFGFTFEDIRFVSSAKTGKQPLGSMGNDAPLAVLSDQTQLLYNYFKQLFAQVTNPPIDPIREELVTASITFLGSEGDLTEPSADSRRMIKLETRSSTMLSWPESKQLMRAAFKPAPCPSAFPWKILSL